MARAPNHHPVMTVASIAASRPGAAPMLEPLGFDWCCGGKATPEEQILHTLWEASGRGSPILITSASIDLNSCAIDFNASGGADLSDIFAFLSAWFAGCP